MPGLNKSTEKKVSFSRRVKVRRTSHLDDYTPQERKSTWYTKNEMQAIREDIGATVKLIEMEIDVTSSKEFCHRGLEHQCKGGAQRRLANKKRAWKAVSDEQAIQRSRGIHDAQALADAYSSQVQECRNIAILLGVYDEQQVYPKTEEVMKPAELDCGNIPPPSISSSCSASLFGRVYHHHNLSTRAA